MATEPLTCPYCNASLEIQTGWMAGQRIVCPRCGDPFTLQFRDSSTDQPHLAQSSETSVTANAPITAVPQLSRWSNRLIAGIVLSVMIFMAGSGLVFMLMTQQQRRAYDTSRPPRRPGKQRGILETDIATQSVETREAVASVAPDKLAALGYLPVGVNFLFAARLPELLAGPLGAQLLHEPIKLGESPVRLENLPHWLGFRLEEIDHVLFSARIDDTVPPPFYVVLRTAQPYDEEQLRQRLKATRVPSSSKKKLYGFRVPQQDIPLNAWFADERTVVLALLADHLSPLPPQPVEDLRQLPEELRTVLKQRHEPAAPIWIAGHSHDWNKTSAALFLNRMKKEDLGKLASLRTFAIFLVPVPSVRPQAERGDEELVVDGVFAAKDEQGAQRLEVFFRALHGPDTDLKTALDGPWLTLQFHTGPDFWARLLKR
jgi:hypothetical protein